MDILRCSNQAWLLQNTDIAVILTEMRSSFICNCLQYLCLIRPHLDPAILAGDWTVKEQLQKFTEVNI